MMEEAFQIFTYLPLRYKSEEKAEYVQYLWKAFENNYQNEQYQFGFYELSYAFYVIRVFYYMEDKEHSPR